MGLRIHFRVMIMPLIYEIMSKVVSALLFPRDAPSRSLDACLYCLSDSQRIFFCPSLEGVPHITMHLNTHIFSQVMTQFDVFSQPQRSLNMDERLIDLVSAELRVACDQLTIGTLTLCQFP